MQRDTAASTGRRRRGDDTVEGAEPPAAPPANVERPVCAGVPEDPTALLDLSAASGYRPAAGGAVIGGTVAWIR